MKKILIIVAVFAVTLTLVNVFMPVHGEEDIYKSVVRLHVIANSDSDEDQALKLKVRDAVLRELPSLIDGCRDRDEVSARLEGKTDYLCTVAKKVIEDSGFEYGCEVALTDEKYPTKNYEGICFPSGTYRSLQIKIGESNGKNWWCVLFPQLCLSSAVRAEEAFVEVGLTPEQYKIITESEDTKYKIRFKILEVIESAVNP